MVSYVKILHVLAVCLFEMKLTIPERVQARVLCRFTRRYYVSLLIRSASGRNKIQIAMRRVVSISQYPPIQ